MAPLAGVVAAVLWWDGGTAGEGNHVWLALDDPCCPGPTYVHFDHLDQIAVVTGQRLAAGDLVGACGRSGGWDCAHLHTELSKGPPAGGWFQWPYGWSRAQVEAAYWKPSDWWTAATALVLAEAGGPVPPEVVMLLSDWQVLNWIMPDLWKWADVDYDPEAGTSKAWLARLRAGHWPGVPVSGEMPYGEGDEAGVWQEFQGGLLCYRLRDGQASWNG